MMWIFTIILVFLTVILETKCTYLNFKGETKVRKFIPEDVHYLNKTKVTTHSNHIIRWKIMNDEANVTSTEETGDTSTSSTRTETIPAKDVTIRTWIPADTTTTTTLEHHHRTQYRNKNVTVRDVCTNYKDEEVKFDLDKMVDVWQTVYYQLSEKLQCFKIYIKHVSDGNRLIYEKKFGTFGGVVNWNECMLEIKAATKMNRKHFLQGNNEDGGVMENIIIVKDKETNTISIQEEVADQWLVVDRLLLMRDCEDGGFVVFARIPFIPRQSDIEDALKLFGEEYGKGKYACEIEKLIRSPEALDEKILDFY